MEAAWRRSLFGRACVCLAFNREAGFPEADARTMTVINLAESGGHLRMVGPVRIAGGEVRIGNTNGTADWTAWQHNASGPIPAAEAARRA